VVINPIPLPASCHLPVLSEWTAQAGTLSSANVLLVPDPSSWPVSAAVHTPACHSAWATDTHYTPVWSKRRSLPAALCSSTCHSSTPLSHCHKHYK